MPTTTTIAADQLAVTRAPGFVELYTNNTQFGHTKFDFAMICRRISYSNNNASLQEIANIAMSPQHAKAVLKALKASVEGYEAVYGEIPEPQDVPPKIAAKRVAKKGV